MKDKDFRQTSKALRVALLMAISQGMTEDLAARFAYYHSLNGCMIDILDDLNRSGEKDPFDQVKMLNVLFGNRTPDLKQHLVDAVKFLQEANRQDEVKVGVTLERRSWFEAPILHAFTVMIGDACKTFTDDGAIYAAS